MLRDLKYLFTGLTIGGTIFLLLAGAFTFAAPENLPSDLRPDFLNTPTFTPAPLPADTQPILATETDTTTRELTATLTTTPTLIPFSSTATATSTVTATLSPGQILRLRGDLAISGPRTEEEQVRLYEVSLYYISNTFSEARKLGEQINGKGYGSPTLICGPLSISMLGAAGLIPGGIVPYNFWLLNPNDAPGRFKLSTVFPTGKYSDIRIKTRIDQINWMVNPLLPGDFVYIYSGTGGNFEHMLVVNRVDSAGRAYSVTNYNTGSGFIIQEVMLYDPNDSESGMFHKWTEREWQLSGSTGYDGIEIWRLMP